MSRLLTTQETALSLHVHPKTVESYFRNGMIKALKIGRNWRVPAEEVSRFVADRLAERRAGQTERQEWYALAQMKLAEVWNHPDEVEYPL